jgi:hypothetical protein
VLFVLVTTLCFPPLRSNREAGKWACPLTTGRVLGDLGRLEELALHWRTDLQFARAGRRHPLPEPTDLQDGQVAHGTSIPDRDRRERGMLRLAHAMGRFGSRQIHAMVAIAVIAAFSVLGRTGQAATRAPSEGDVKTPPKAWTEEAGLVEPRTAWLNGVINPRGVPTVYRFQYGSTESYGRTATGVEGTYDRNKRYAVAAFVEGLRPGTTYHFRVVAINRDGTTRGGDMTFTTPEPQTAKPRTVIACFHAKISRFTALAHPDRCNIWGYRGKQFVGVPIKGMKWGHWGFNPTRAAHGTDLLDGTGVRVIAYRPVSCDEGRTWYSRAVIVFPGDGRFFGLRLLTCDGPSVVG